MRDSLSILERCLQDGETKIDDEKIKDLVGIPKFIYINNITKAIVNYSSSSRSLTISFIGVPEKS